jgi:hypothetical protein
VIEVNVLKKILPAMAAAALILLIIPASVLNIGNAQGSACWRAPYKTTGLPAPVNIHLAVLNQGGIQKICASFYSTFGDQVGSAYCTGSPWYRGELTGNAVWTISWTVTGSVPADGSIRVYGVKNLQVAPTGFVVFGAPTGSFSLTFFPTD